MNYKDLNSCEALLCDGDDSLWKKKITEGICKDYLSDELADALNSVISLNFDAGKDHLAKFYNGAVGALDVLSIVKKDPIYGEANGLKRAYEILVENGLGTKEKMKYFAKKHIEKKKIKGAKELIEKWYPKKSFLATLAGSSAAKAAKEYFEMNDCVSNIDNFDKNGNLTGVNLILRNGEDKLNAVNEMLKKYGLEVSHCAFIADSTNDIPLAQEVKLLIASPFAIGEIKNMADIRINESYKELF